MAYIDGQTAEMSVSACSVADFLLCFIFPMENYTERHFFKTLVIFSSPCEEYSVEISSHNVGLVSFLKMK